MSGYQFSNAVYHLQSDSANLHEKVLSLRYLKHHLDDHDEIDPYNKKRINQLILDNIFKIILSEEKSMDVRKRQLVLNDPQVMADTRLKALNLLASQEHSGGSEFQVTAHQRRTPTPSHTFSSHNFSNEIQNYDWMVSASERQHTGKTVALARGTPESKPATAKRLSMSQSGTSLESLKLTLMKPAILKNSRKLLSKSLKPRPSVLFSDKLESDGFVPGVDPHNFIEQDKKLGYQKSRMWFPKPDVRVDAHMVPAERRSANRVVEEYLQMRALASFVGDLVMPYAPGKRKHDELNVPAAGGEQQEAAAAEGAAGTMSPVRAVKQRRQNRVNPDDVARLPPPPSTAALGSPAKPSRLAGFTDPNRFNEALGEAAALWTPLLGVHLPRWVKKQAPDLARESRYRELRPFSLLAEEGSDVDEDTGTYDDSSLTSAASSVLHSLAADAKQSPRAADTQPSNFHHAFSEYSSLRSKRRRLAAPADLSYAAQMRKYQSDMNSEIEAQKSNLSASMRATEAMIHRTMKAQYASLPQRYIVLLEGGKANSRKVIANTFFIFCRVKKRNLLELAWGVWRILLVTSRSLALRPKYSRVAAMHLMATWGLNVHRKNLKIFLSNWRRSVTMIIFLERTRCAITFQKHFRSWRDRRKFIRMHLAGTFNGVLSDIFLAPKRRKLLYFIPDTIRKTRRMLWLAAIIIQSRFRCWWASKDYFYKRKLVVRLQSLMRMWPKRLQFLRLRAAAIKCQAWSRRTIKRNLFKLMKKSALIIERYVRRYLSQLRVGRLKDGRWRFSEKVLASVIMIQCRWREHAARKRVKRVKFYHAMRQYSALVIQRNYFRFRRAFHTFFLMCALRVREEEDIKLERLAVRMGRNKCARRIQRVYKERHQIRMIGSVIRVQCWYRGRLGYSQVDILRRQRWASRKLRHWGRVRFRRIVSSVRKIQSWWLHLKKGRLLAHLKRRRADRDRKEHQRIVALRNGAATKIQTRIRGIRDRKWVRRHKAAKLIQKNFKFFNGLRKWKNWKRKRILKGVTKYVEKQFAKAIGVRVKQLLVRHSLMVIKPQAVVRGFLVRVVFRRVRQHAYRLGLAAVLIQRFWRKSGALSKAVEEVMALRRMAENPFKECGAVHEVLVVLRKQSAGLYSARDPRAGMRVTQLMYRLGLSDMTDMFPRKDFRFVADMQRLTMDRMHVLYNVWKANRGKKNKGEEEEKKGKKKAAPVAVFQLILDVVTPPFFTRKRSEVEKINQVASLPECLTPNKMVDFAKKLFLKKFGKHLLVRAQHISTEIMENVWKKYNNYKAFGWHVTTSLQVSKALTNANEASHVHSQLEEIRMRPPTAADDRKWDKERLKSCADLLQLAIDQCMAVLPPGPMLDMVERAISRVSSHKRKMSFLQVKLFHSRAAVLKREKERIDKMLALSKGGKDKGAKGAAAAGGHSAGAHHHHQEEPVQETTNELKKLTPLDQPNSLLSAGDSVDLPFDGQEDDLDLEQLAGICKLYFDALDRLYVASSGINSLKNMWSNSAIKRALAQEKLKMFLDSATKAYLSEQGVDHVKVTWNKFKKIELNAQKLKMIMKSIYEARELLEATLATVPRFGWESVADEYGYWYWADWRPHSKEEPTYDMPAYSVAQWRAAVRIQRRGRQYLVGAIERHRLRMEAKQAEMDRQREALEAEMRRGMREVACRLVVRARALHPEARHKPITAKYIASLVPSLEALLPWKYQFEASPVFRSGMWALLKHVNATSGHTTYDIVMVFRMKADKNMCDVRTVKGSRMRNVPLDRLCLMNLDVGTRVEVRFKGRKVFYRAAISKIDDYTQPHLLYGVSYEDGESERGLNRDLIRPTTSALQHFLTQREALLQSLKLQHRRMLHFATLKQKRYAAARSASAPSSSTAASSALVLVTDAAPSDLLAITAGEAPTSPSAEEGALVVLPSTDELDRDKNLTDGDGDGDGTDGEDNDEREGGGDDASVNSRGERSVASKDTAVTGVTGATAATAAVTLASSVVVVQKEASSAEGALVPQVQIRFRIDVKLFARYSKFPLRHGCSEQRVRGSFAMRYWDEWGQQVEEKPVYSTEQILLVNKCQTCWLNYKARKLLHRKVLSYSLLGLVDHVVDRCSRIAFVGFETEGVTAMMFLRRAGYYELAEAIELYHKSTKQSTASLVLETICNMNKDGLESIGVLQQAHLKDARELQAWWKKTPPPERMKKLSLMNHYSDCYDTRSVQQCIQDSEEAIAKRFLRVLKTSQSKTRTAVASVVKDSVFPMAHLQIETYLRKYADKPDMARDAVFELVNKATTHTFHEERVVFRHYRHVTRQICAILRELKLKKMLRVVTEAARKADAVMLQVQGLHDRDRLFASGSEGKAAWILRQDVLHFVSKSVRAALTIQRKVRAYRLAKIWRAYLEARIRSTYLIQKVARRFAAYRIVRGLKAQQWSEWEQLWDVKRKLLYYYNNVTGRSTYEEPEGPFRPLVRDPKSAVLIQAWPSLGSSRQAGAAAAPNGGVLVPRNATCGICKTRLCVRICYDCASDDRSQANRFPYCFPCFIREHTEEKLKSGHNFDVVEAVEEEEEVVLRCCTCDDVATRKCNGAISEAKIDSVMAELRATEPARWATVLQKADVAGDRKISLLLDQVRSGESRAGLAAGQLQEVRALLERMRSECDECYCATCYVEVHSGGRRAQHTWKGFSAGAPVCRVCTNGPAESTCMDCPNQYCESCFKAFHEAGRKRRHRKEVLLEDLAIGEVYCGICKRRPGNVSCPEERCDNVHACDSCFECIHKPKCDRDIVLRKRSASTKGGSFDPDAPMCVVCSDPADAKCHQCGDFYCSKTWMGNPGCFISYHSKGNRVHHTVEPLNRTLKNIKTRKQSVMK